MMKMKIDDDDLEEEEDMAIVCGLRRSCGTCSMDLHLRQDLHPSIHPSMRTHARTYKDRCALTHCTRLLCVCVLLSFCSFSAAAAAAAG
jgi:ferredoxin